MTGRALTIVLWILQSLLAATFFAAGGSKLAGVQQAVEMYDQIGWGQRFRYVTGLVEVGSALMLLVPSLALYGAILIICTMIGAIISRSEAAETRSTLAHAHC
jgi:putative oxidoreductase